MGFNGVASFLIVAGVCLNSQLVGATTFVGTGKVTSGDADSTLVAELLDALGTGKHHARIEEFERALQRSFASLPKSEDGHLGQRAVRYVLHRLFVQRHGWYIKGLEPTGDAWHTSSNASLQDWVPSFLLGRLDARLGERGMNLAELAALAAALEDLVNKEADARLETAYEVQKLPTSERITSKQAEEVLDTYMMVYLLGGKLSVNSLEELEKKKHIFHKKYAGWKEADTWLHDIEGTRLSSHTKDGVDFATTKQIAEEIGEKYGTFNDKECRDLKTTLVQMQSGKAGRVRLSDFYNMSLYSHWKFSEKPEYLRALGALDESEGAGKASVIIANYITARPNCLEASSLYAMCCRDECEDLLGHIEEKIASPVAHADRIAQLVAALPSDTVTAPRNLPEPLLRRLRQIADAHGGEVNIHGRLFSQWMHHAFPRECPYPHEAGHASPQTPDEWMAKTGHASSTVTEEEMRRHVQSITKEDEAYGTESELPWSEAEQLLASEPLAFANARKSGSWAGFFFRWLLAIVVMAFGVWSRTSHDIARFARVNFGSHAKFRDGLTVFAFAFAGFLIGFFDRLTITFMFIGGLAMGAAKIVSARFEKELLPGGHVKGRGARLPTWGKVADKLV